MSDAPSAERPRISVAEYDRGAETRSLVNDAYRALKASILDGTLPAGYQAVEKQIAQQLNMSRTPVHEAVIRLESEGFLRVLPRRGVQIVRLSADDMRETYDLIIALEGMAAALIAALPRETAEPIAASMRADTDAMEQALERDDLRAWAAADDRFHRTLVADCGNGRLARLAATMTDQAQRARIATLRMRQKPERSIVEHREILAALAASDAQAARQAVERHRTRASREIIEAISTL
jgi:DNA-binding GntR family transcriptional regulator